jgi:hypothetical protein
METPNFNPVPLYMSHKKHETTICWATFFLDSQEHFLHTSSPKMQGLITSRRALPSEVKSLMGALAIGRKGIEIGESYQLREPAIPYGVHFGAEKCDIGSENAYFLDVNH